jgi:hypothetical protein
MFYEKMFYILVTKCKEKVSVNVHVHKEGEWLRRRGYDIGCPR